jgi:N-acetylmuramoyl-L-alanine amidase
MKDRKNETKRLYLFVILLALIASCSSNKYAVTNKIYKKQAKVFANTIKAMPPAEQEITMIDPGQRDWVGSVNFGIRRPNFVILHHTAQKSSDETLKTFTLARTQVSAHYVIGRDGKVFQMVNDYLRAQHAGVGKWGNDTDLNSSSIGIEIDNNGDEPYSGVQIRSLLEVLAALKKRYGIPVANFIGHADIAPTRKPDPNKFPWKTLAEKGFGYWYDSVLLMPPDNFDTTLALRIIGYDVKNLPAAITAFKRHFVQTDITPVLTAADKLILFNLYKKYM